MAYLPNILTCVLAYSHFACFFGVLINEIFVTEKRPGEGGKTKANRVFWVRTSPSIQSCASSTSPSSQPGSPACRRSSSDFPDLSLMIVHSRHRIFYWMINENCFKLWGSNR